MIGFKIAEKAQKNLIYSWLNKLHVSEWWHGQGLKNTLNGLERFFSTGKAHFLPWVAYKDNQAFGLILTSKIMITDLDEGNYIKKWANPDKKHTSMDLLIGEEAFLGKGLACSMIQQFIDKELTDTDIIFIDPEKKNTKAVHVYKKAGFELIDTFIASWHPVEHLLMRKILNS